VKKNNKFIAFFTILQPRHVENAIRKKECKHNRVKAKEIAMFSGGSGHAPRALGKGTYLATVSGPRSLARSLAHTLARALAILQCKIKIFIAFFLQ
jgi:hypothetical protein